MSTPTTATATLPHYPHSHYPFSHHQPYSANSSAAYRSANQILPTSGRLAPYSATTSSQAGINGSALSASSSSGSSRHDMSSLSSSSNSNYTTMPVSAAAVAQSNGTSTATAVVDSQPARKRRRSREPDWHTFYKNGLPKEIIIIDDDSPEPDQSSVSAASKALVNGAANGNHTNGVNGGTTNGTAARHIAKKRKRDDEGTRYDPVHHSKLNGSATNTPHHNETPSGSTISSDRTNSAIHTTAATSLGSLSSSGHYDYDTQPGQKRKRTRQQIANEAKRRELGLLGQSYTSYRPPPHPVKKASDVHVRVVPDVRHPNLTSIISPYH